MDMITVTAKTVDEAVTKALIELETTSDKLEYEVVDKGSTGFLGIGAKPAIIRAKKKESIEDKAMDFLSQIFGAMNMQVNITAAYNQEEQEIHGLILNENYRERRKETLETLAKNIAYKVKRTKRPVSLEPMNPYERRIIHAALQNDKYVTTRSEGEEPFRHVVIALKKEAASGDRKGRYDRNKGGRFERSDRSGGYRNNRRTNGNSASQTGSDASAETAAGEEE